MLSNLQNIQVVQDAISGVAALWDWGRWCQRCMEFGMIVADKIGAAYSWKIRCGVA